MASADLQHDLNLTSTEQFKQKERVLCLE